MKRKRLAMLLAIAMTVTSLDSTAIVASGADFSSEAEEISTQAEEGTEVTEDTSADVDFSDEETAETTDAADVEVTEEPAQEEEVPVEEDAEEADFSSDVQEEVAVDAGDSIIPAETQKLEVGKNYEIKISRDSAVWFSYTPAESGRYILSSDHDHSADPMVYMYDSADVESEDSWIQCDDDSKGSLDFMLSAYLETGKTYYYQVKNNWNEESTCTVHFEKGLEIENVTIDDSEAKKEFIAGLDKYTAKGVKLLITYKGQSTQTVLTFNEDSVELSDGKGNSFWYQLTREENWYSPYDTLTEGQYQATVYSNSKGEIGKISATAVKASAYKFDTMKVGSNTVEIQKDNNLHWYLFEAPEDGLYTVVRPAEDYEGSVYRECKIFDEDGNAVAGQPEYDGDNEAYAMKKGEKALWAWGTYWDERVSTEEMIITKVPRVKSVNVKADVKSEYIQNIDYVQPKNIQTVVTYEDGTTQTLNSYEDDSYGRSVYWKLYDQNGEEQYDYDSDFLPVGNYTLKFYFCGVEANEIPLKVVALDSKITDEISDGESNIDNKGKLVLKYTAAEEGRYRFTFNVDVSEVKVLRTDGYYTNYSSSEDKIVYADLEKGVTYYIYAVPDEVCEKLTVNVSLSTRPTSLKARSLRKADYIAGIDYFSSDDIETTVNFGNTSTTVRGRNKVEGYEVSYVLTNTDNGDTAYDGATLPKGTWSVAPSLASGSSIEVPVEAATVKSVMYSDEELKKFPTLAEGTWNTLKNTYGERTVYTFTPKESGVYRYECKVENHGEPLSFYEAGTNEYVTVRQDDSEAAVMLTKGKTYLVVNTYGTADLKISPVDSASKPETVKQLALTVGMKKAVEFDKETGHMECTFTPSEDGYYVLKSSRYEGIYADSYAELRQGNKWVDYDSYSGAGRNFTLGAKLSAGKKYTYTIWFYNEEEYAPFILEFEKTEKKEIKSVDIALKDGKNAADFSMFEDFNNFYQLRVNYTDGTSYLADVNVSYDYEEDSVQDPYGHWIGIYLRKEGSETENKVTLQSDITYTDADNREHHVKIPVDCKTVGSLEEVKEGRNYQVPKSTKQYKFIPQETGEYIFTLSDNNAYINAYVVDGVYRYMTAATCYEGDNTRSGKLEKGKTYYISVGAYENSETNATFQIRKMKKTLNGLTLKKAPDNTTILPNAGTVSYKGLQVEASYTDGSTETLTYGQADSEGRYLYADRIIWLADNKAKVYVSIGRYSVSFDAKAGSWDAVEEIKLGESKTLNAGKDDITTLKFVPKETGVHYIYIDNGYLTGVIRGTDAEDDRDYYNGCYLKAGKTYYLSITATKDNPTVTVRTVCKDNKHSFGEWEIIKDATCVDEGLRKHTCTNCGQYEEEKIPATGEHTYGEWQVTTEATCVEEGEKTRSCTGCGKTETEKIPATGEHTYGEWKVTTEATCTEDGVKKRTCSICGETETDVLKATGHVWGDEQRVEPTETASGKRYHICTICNIEEILEVLPATGVAARVDDVKKDLDSISDEVISGNITDETKEKVNNAVESITSIDNEELAKDKNAMDTIKALEDTVLKTNTDKVAETETAVEDETIGEVEVKGAALTAATVEAKEGQKLAAKVSVKAADAENAKKYEDLPENKGKSVMALNITLAVVDKANNDAVVGEAAIQPKAPIQMTVNVPAQYQGRELELYHIKDGKQEALTYTLNAAGTKLTFVITALSDFTMVAGKCAEGQHSYGDWEETKPATCVTSGSRQHTCVKCGEVETEEIPATGEHQWEEAGVVTEATCAKDGVFRYQCKVCQKTRDEAIKATGKHTMGSWKVTSEPTAVAEGIQERSCTVCGKKESAKIAKLNPTVKLNVTIGKTLPLKVKQSFQVKASGLAKGDKVVSWKSSSTKIATVSKTGKIAGKKAGTATITVKLASGKSVWFKVKVQKSTVATTSLKVVNKATGKTLKSATLKAKKKLTLVTTIAPVTSQQKVTYSSSNKKVATVSSKGVITAKKKGKATITIKSGKKSVKIKITVK